jgi:hypothetical protein
MLKSHGTAVDLPHAARAALNTASSLLLDAKKLAHKFYHAREGSQERTYVAAATQDIKDLEPGATLLVPCCAGKSGGSNR